jgi:hypothetical protein
VLIDFAPESGQLATTGTTPSQLIRVPYGILLKFRHFGVAIPTAHVTIIFADSILAVWVGS